MKRQMTNQQALDLRTPGRHSVGGNLFLLIRVTPAGTLSRAWTFKYEKGGVTHEMGLGSILRVSPTKARLKAARLRLMLDEGKDPWIPKTPPAAVPETFRSYALAFIEAKGVGWKPKHRAGWRKATDDYLAPLAGQPIAAIDTQAVKQCLEPLFDRIPATALKVRGMLEMVLASATSLGLRSGPNPAAWKGHLANILPGRGNDAPNHHEAMPYDDVPRFMHGLRGNPSVAARALEFTILCAARSGEVRFARWEEFDLAGKIWVVPAHRMKGKREHRVPLSDRAMEILQDLAARRSSDLVFLGARMGSPIGKMAMANLVPAPFTVHGTARSSFRDWAFNETDHPREIVEQALAHTVGAVERAYRRSDALGRRRRLAVDWSRFCRVIHVISRNSA